MPTPFAVIFAILWAFLFSIQFSILFTIHSAIILAIRIGTQFSITACILFVCIGPVLCRQVPNQPLASFSSNRSNFTDRQRREKLELLQELAMMLLSMLTTFLQCWKHHYTFLQGHSPHPLLKSTINMHKPKLMFWEHYSLSWHIKIVHMNPKKWSPNIEYSKCAKMVREVRIAGFQEGHKKNR